MNALLRDLEHDPSKQRRRAAVILALLLAVTFAIFRGVTSDARTCTGGAVQFADLWSSEQKQALTAIFNHSGQPWAADVWKTTRSVLGKYRDDWIAMHAEACRATRVHGEQSETLLDLRMECLRQRRRDFEAVTTLLAEGDPTVLERGTQAANALPSLRTCADANALLAPIAPPRDPALSHRIAALRDRLATARATLQTGHYDRGLETAGSVVADAEELDYWPLNAEALLLLGILQEEKGDGEAASGTLERALWAATAGGHDQVAVTAFVHLVRVSGYQLQDFSRASRWAAQAKALLPRLGEPDELEATLADHQGLLLFHRGEFEQALLEHRRALALRLEVHGPHHPDVALTQNRIGNVLAQMGDPRQALNFFETALAINEAAYGPSHPHVANNLDLVGTAASELGEYERARDVHQQALEILHQAFGKRHSKVATVALHLGAVHSALGQPARALELYRQALEVYEETLGPDHPNTAAALANIGGELLDLDRGQEALEHYQRALEIQRRAYGKDHPWVAMTLYNLGAVLNALEEHGGALKHHREALDLWRRVYGADHPYLADALTGIGRSLRELGRPQEALEPLEQALQIHLQVDQDSVFQAYSRFELAQSLGVLGRQPERARTLARWARDTFAATGQTRYLQRAEAWLTTGP